MHLKSPSDARKLACSDYLQQAVLIGMPLPHLAFFVDKILKI